MSLFDESDKNDFFENADVPEKKLQPKKEKLSPDDPRYWEEPEDEFEHLKPKGDGRKWIWIWAAATAVVIGVLWAGYLRYFHAYIQDATQSGYVEQIAQHGDVFKTYEGVLIPYKNIMDTTRSYEGDFEFSTSDADIAARLKKLQFANKPVRLTYKVYHTTMPWRGTTPIVVTAVDSVDENNLLPPERLRTPQ